MSKGIYVAATNQHVGKTTSTLGLVSVLKNQGHNIAYCKPVGQQFVDLKDLRVDKDTLLFADLLHQDIEADIHSPVILGSGATSSYLDDPSAYHYKDAIRFASKTLSERHDVVIYEGTGHPGVGSVVDLSNAQVASMLNLPVIMIVEGGIGSTLDRLYMSTSLFREYNVPIMGVILNKVLPEKMEKVKYYVSKKCKEWDMDLLGAIPYNRSMAYPIMSSIVKAVNGIVITNEDQLENKVEDTISGSLIDDALFEEGGNYLLVAGADRINEPILKVQRWINDHPNRVPLSGILATGVGEITSLAHEFVEKYRIPFVRTRLDTLGSVLKISRIEVKINLNTPWKISTAIDLINKNVDFDKINEYIES